VSHLDYPSASILVPDDLQHAHRFLLEHIRSPGTWWTGAERVAIATESRQAASCALCSERKASLSLGAVHGVHDGPHDLPDAVVDTVHRIRTDPARLSKTWFDGVIAGGLEVTHYVELVGVTTLLAGIDYFALALGSAPLPLPPPLPGEPSRHRPAAAKDGTAWVPMVAPEDATGSEANLYPEAAVTPNIVRAMSLVPAEVRAFARSSDAHYLPLAQIPDPTARRTLDRAQMELVAARVSALNQCFY
jgi:hypothetical protein